MRRPSIGWPVSTRPESRPRLALMKPGAGMERPRNRATPKHSCAWPRCCKREVAVRWDLARRATLVRSRRGPGVSGSAAQLGGLAGTAGSEAGDWALRAGSPGRRSGSRRAARDHAVGRPRAGAGQDRGACLAHAGRPGRRKRRQSRARASIVSAQPQRKTRSTIPGSRSSAPIGCDPLGLATGRPKRDAGRARASCHRAAWHRPRPARPRRQRGKPQDPHLTKRRRPAAEPRL